MRALSISGSRLDEETRRLEVNLHTTGHFRLAVASSSIANHSQSHITTTDSRKGHKGQDHMCSGIEGYLFDASPTPSLLGSVKYVWYCVSRLAICKSALILIDPSVVVVTVLILLT